MGWPTKQDADSGDEGSQVNFFMNKLKVQRWFFQFTQFTDPGQEQTGFGSNFQSGKFGFSQIFMIF